MSGHEDHSGDYGYDLAHEVKAFLRLPSSRNGPSTPSIGPRREVDPEGDLGYDQAHEF